MARKHIKDIKTDIELEISIYRIDGYYEADLRTQDGYVLMHTGYHDTEIEAKSALIAKCTNY